jgi:hypothetical protein
MAENDQELADPVEHPEQHAALKTGEQGQAEPDTEPDETFDSEEHSEEGGPFGTSNDDGTAS